MTPQPPLTPQQMCDRAMGKPPYWGTLLDPRARLTPAQWRAYPELHVQRLFVVVEHQLDRDEAHPGLWVRPLLHVPAALLDLDAPQFDYTPFLQHSTERPEANWRLDRRTATPAVPLWLNAAWCTFEFYSGFN